MGLAATMVLLLAAVGYGLASWKPLFLPLSRGAIIAAGGLLIAVVVWRSVEEGFPALTGIYEGSLVGVIGLIAFVAAGQRRVFRDRPLLLGLTTGLAFVLMALLSSPLVSDELRPPVPILRSGWLVLHVAFAFVGLALFTLGAAAAIFGAIGRKTDGADRVRDLAIAFGFVFYATGGIVFGAIWAEAAWGRFWGWDPKEIWALVTTLVYAVYLHLRYMRGVGRRVERVLAVAAWVVAMFTFLGVNYLFQGLHSYG